MLQDLRLHGPDMRMDNDLWPVVRESARRVLRLENISIELPIELASDFNELCDEISQNIPSRLVFPKVVYSEAESIEIKLLDSKPNFDETIVVIGMIEPDENVCWIESEIFQGWAWLIESCHELLEAGYPGCIGCGGPNSEEPWNEVQYRSNRKLLEKK